MCELLAHEFAPLPHKLDFVCGSGVGLLFEGCLGEELGFRRCVNVILALFDCWDWLLAQNFLQVSVFGDVAFLKLYCFGLFEQQIVQAFAMIVLIFQSENFFVELVQKQTRVLNDGPVIGGFKGEQRVELLNQAANKYIFYV